MFYVNKFTEDKVQVINTDDWSSEWLDRGYVFYAAKFLKIEGISLEDNTISLYNLDNHLNPYRAKDKLSNVQSTYNVFNKAFSTKSEKGEETTLETIEVGSLSSLVISKGLKTYLVPDGIYMIGSVKVEKGVDSFNMILPKSVKMIGSSAFAKTPIESINLNSIEMINYRAFQDCPKLTEISLGAIETINEGAFKGSALQKVNVADGVSIQIKWFDGVNQEVRFASLKE